MPGFLLRLALVAGFLMGTGGCCRMQDISMAVARGAEHVTFAQRAPDPALNGYLVDCKVAQDGALRDCYTIELKGE